MKTNSIQVFIWTYHENKVQCMRLQKQSMVLVDDKVFLQECVWFALNPLETWKVSDVNLTTVSKLRMWRNIKKL